MNVNALSNVFEPYIQSLRSRNISGAGLESGAAGASSVGSSSPVTPQAGTLQLSPFAQLLSTLQQLQKSDPAKYQQVTSQVATNLESAARTATANGSTSQAAELNQLATDFSSASQNSTLPNIQDLAMAVGGVHGRHQHRHWHVSTANPVAASTDGTAGSASSSSAAAALTDGTSGSASAAGAASVDDLSRLISAYLVNATSSAQNASLDPLSIIQDTLTNAGITISR